MNNNNKDLFTYNDSELSQAMPLAARMRPRTIDEYIGQEHILGKGRLLRRAIKADQLSSVIFYGPPGTGKTTLARVISNTTKSHFSTLNAVLSGVKELRDEISAAKERKELYGMRTILFIDEVHRWNKSQQDALLPWVENGTVILIGATTENPYFEVNSALVSRSRVFQLKSLSEENLMAIAEQALNDRERGYGKYNIEFEGGALEHIVKVASGDARSLLNALELAVETTPLTFPPSPGEKIYITKEAAEESIQQKIVLYDKEGDYHFDVISAFIKSIRGSDPDAALYWLARMVAAGEDPKFIFRRLLISAAEDIGLAEPNAVAVVASDASAFDRIGMPEGRFHLSHATIYLATCPKSNSTMAFFDALAEVESESSRDIPNHLKDASRDKDGFGHGEGYMYPHAYKDHWVAQQYLPTGLQGKVFYQPSSSGYEAKLKSEVLAKREAQLEAVTEDLYKEKLTYSPGDKNRAKWVERAMSGRSSFLIRLTEELYRNVDIRRSDNVLVLNASHGLLLWPLVKLNPEGLTVAEVSSAMQRDIIAHFTEELDELAKPMTIVARGHSELFSALEEGLTFSLVVGRNLLSYLKQDSVVLNSIKSVLDRDGELRLIEAIPSRSSRLSEFAQSSELKSSLLKAEGSIYTDSNPLTSWGERELKETISTIFNSVEVRTIREREERIFTQDSLNGWYDNTYSAFGIDREEFINAFKDRTVPWDNTIALITAKNC